MGSSVAAQLGKQRRALQLGGGAALALCAIPGLPKLPFLVVGVAILLVASRVPKDGEPAVDLPAPGVSLSGCVRGRPSHRLRVPAGVPVVDDQNGITAGPHAPMHDR